VQEGVRKGMGEQRKKIQYSGNIGEANEEKWKLFLKERGSEGGIRV